MKVPDLKPPVYIFTIALLLSYFFVSCTKTNPNIIPGKYNPNGSTVGATGTTGVTGTTGTTDSTSTAPFSSPDDVAVDAAGNVYVADFGNNLIRKISPAGIVSTLAGSGNAGAINATGILASFNGPSGVAVDATGNVYVADEGNNLIRKITPTGDVSTLAGTIVAADTSNTVSAEPLFANPSGVAVDAAGNVYVADAGNNRICVVNPAGGVSTLAGNINPGIADGTGTAATFNNPTGLAIDASGNVYVADLLNNLIRKITPAGVVTTIAGSGAIGAADGVGNLATFYFPNSLALDATGNIYVTDDINNLIRKVAPDGTVTTIAGTGLPGATNGTGTLASFNDPAGIAIDNAGNAYVADANNNLIREISPAGVVTTFAGHAPALSVIRRTPLAHYHTAKGLVGRHLIQLKVH